MIPSSTCQFYKKNPTKLSNAYFQEIFIPVCKNVHKVDVNSYSYMFYFKDKTQITMLVTWLIEIFLNQLGEMKEQGQDESDEYRKVQEEFRMFLAQPKNKVSAVHCLVCLEFYCRFFLITSY